MAPGLCRFSYSSTLITSSTMKHIPMANITPDDL